MVALLSILLFIFYALIIKTKRNFDKFRVAFVAYLMIITMFEVGLIVTGFMFLSAYNYANRDTVRDPQMLNRIEN